ncbi:AAA family ATPase [Fusobacterium polymorphum]|uniref:ATP-binding protein n=1 Tax=Fusobacterium nucleatum subsp. polymorphum TaxID=76857 RepID=A0A2C6BY66_FUSNP|nr:ATP-binding protein [Fusobacterium polymorphum]PHH98892.1 ATP-binding protein [Fusobacterium polymorphum]PHI09151.1 ATP-binding protein [Fusobacterium polymorphum]PIM76284.1 ATP-binding protein [Fusobacterium polymorphum]
MKIEKVHIKNIRGIKDLELSFKKDNKILDVIVLAGVNGSGKTTILEAIKDFFYNENVNYDEPEKSNVNLDIFLEEFEKYSSYNLKRVKFLNTFHYKKSDNNTSSQNQTINNFKSLAKIIYVPAENNFEKVKTDTTTLLRISQFINIINSNVIKDIPSYIATRRNYLATIEEDLTMKEITNKVINEINGIFDILELDVKLKGFSKDEKTLPIFENSAGEEFDINDLSSGEKQLFLRTLSIKMLEPNNSIILIDEPELSLHPKWQQRIIEVYKKIGENNQIIVATHSPHILGSVSNENIFILYRNENGKIEAKTGDELYSSYGQPVDRVLKDIMGLKSVRTPKIDRDIQELRKLVDEDKYNTEEFKEKYNNLLEILGSTDEDLFLIDMDAKLKQKVNSNVESK